MSTINISTMHYSPSWRIWMIDDSELILSTEYWRCGDREWHGMYKMSRCYIKHVVNDKNTYILGLHISKLTFLKSVISLCLFSNMFHNLTAPQWKVYLIPIPIFKILADWKAGISKHLLFLTLYDVERFINIPLLYSGDTFEYTLNSSVTTAFNLSTHT